MAVVGERVRVKSKHLASYNQVGKASYSNVKRWQTGQWEDDYYQVSLDSGRTLMCIQGHNLELSEENPTMKIRITDVTLEIHTGNICEKNDLTVGKVYDVLEEFLCFGDEYVAILDNRGLRHALRKSIVEIVKEPSESSKQALEEAIEIEETMPVSTHELETLLQDTRITFSMDYLTESTLTYRLGTDHAEYAFNNINDTIKAIEALKFLSENEEE